MEDFEQMHKAATGLDFSVPLSTRQKGATLEYFINGACAPEALERFQSGKRTGSIQAILTAWAMEGRIPLGIYRISPNRAPTVKWHPGQVSVSI